MTHCDPDVLALAALGEPISSDVDANHLAGCLDCQRELESLAATVRIARSGPTDLATPPDSVWQGVQATLAAAPAPLSLPQVRKRPRWLAPVAVAAGILVIAGSVTIGRSLGQGPTPTIVAAATLTTLPGAPASASGSASLQQTGNTRTLVVETAGLANPQGFYEVWLMSPDDKGLVSLGTMSGGQTQATFQVPSELPLAVYTNVDISDEPVDGNPAHSAVSLLRGQLTV